MLDRVYKKTFICREVFADFDPIAVSKFNEKKIIAPGSAAASLLSELKLRAIIENARQISKVDSHFLSVDLFQIAERCVYIGHCKLCLYVEDRKSSLAIQIKPNLILVFDVTLSLDEC